MKVSQEKKKFTKVLKAYKKKLRGRAKSSTWTRPPYGTTSGYPYNSSLSKRKEFFKTDPIDSRVLYREPITDIDQTSANFINQRQRQIVDCVGFDLHYQVFNNTAAFPTYFNIAVVSMQAQTVSGAPVITDFFRGSTGNRGQDFSNALNGIDFHSLPINSDDYKVLAHKRHIIAPARTAPLYGGDEKGYLSEKLWIPFKRQLRYTRATTNRPTADACFLVYWCDRFNALNADTPIIGALQMQWKVVTYFKEPM